jgi:hypothetical protein
MCFGGSVLVAAKAAIGPRRKRFGIEAGTFTRVALRTERALQKTLDGLIQAIAHGVLFPLERF